MVSLFSFDELITTGCLGEKSGKNPLQLRKV